MTEQEKRLLAADNLRYWFPDGSSRPWKNASEMLEFLALLEAGTPPEPTHGSYEEWLENVQEENKNNNKTLNSA